MRRIAPWLVALLTAACTPPAPVSAPAQPAPAITARRIEAHMRFLSHDLLEGRAVGSRGIDLAAQYHVSVFRALGLQPLFGRSFLQPFTVVGSRPDPRATVALLVGQREVQLTPLQDFVVTSQRRDAPAEVKGELVYVGYLIQAPDQRWDDIKGVDLRGKILLAEVNEPGNTEGGSLFAGRDLTYYGRWTYKFEQADRLGAAGVLLIHDQHRATYSWDVVRNSWSKEGFFLPGKKAAPFYGWLSGAAAARAMAAGGADHGRLLARAERADFRPQPLGVTVRVRQRPTFRQLAARNVGALLRGQHPRRRARAVVITAHLDHLGRAPGSAGDTIYNGAVDNSSALATLLTLAAHFAGQARDLRLDLVFLAPTAEEVGLLGSAHFIAHPPLPVTSMVANLNLELTNVWGPTHDVYAIGARTSELDRFCRQAARDLGLQYLPEQGGEDGYFYRSDQLSFARAGVPAVWLHEGDRLRGAGKGPRAMGHLRRQYKRQHYHRVSDQWRPGMDLRGAVQIAHWARRVVELLGQAPQPPRMHRRSVQALQR